MIVIPQLVATDTELTTGLPSGKMADSAQDFLALLAGALGADGAQGQDGSLTLADLRAASGKLPNGLLAQESDTSHAVNLADLLAGKEASPDALVKGLSEAQQLLASLTPAQKSTTLAALSQSVRHDEDKPALSDDDLANLSALFAMLPVPTATAPVATSKNASAVDSVLKGSDRATPSGLGNAFAAGESLKGNIGAAAQENVPTGSKEQLLAPVVAQTAAPAGADSSPSAMATSVAMAPVSSSSPQPTLPANTAPVLSAPLGSGEWQQSLSQHITLFTRQGQQSAELRLHPEDLGQVQISLKLEDNHAQLQMISAHSHVRAALEAALPVLRTQLAESGIQLGQSSISSESFAGQQHAFSQQQHGASTPGQQTPLADDESELAVPASLQAAARGTGTVDIFA